MPWLEIILENAAPEGQQKLRLQENWDRKKYASLASFYKVGEQHLVRYANEFDFLYNTRKVTDSERSHVVLKGIGGKRLMYRHS
jgi:hypothetical protein